jgi:hypothetical protein
MFGKYWKDSGVHGCDGLAFWGQGWAGWLGMFWNLCGKNGIKPHENKWKNGIKPPVQSQSMIAKKGHCQPASSGDLQRATGAMPYTRDLGRVKTCCWVWQLCKGHGK